MTQSPFKKNKYTWYVAWFAMLQVLFIFILTTSVCSRFEDKSMEEDIVTHRKTGAPNPTETLTIQSSILGEERRIYVQLPEGYGDNQTRYPLLLVLDGEWLYELASANVRFFSEYDVMDITIPKMIVVGIENINRDRDYVPTPDPKDDPDFPTAGKADQFIQFLSQELFPLLEQQYSTAPSRLIIGWSFGGLFAMYSAVARPELFDAYLCIGPAIWWDDEFLMKRYQGIEFERPKRMVITLGSGEKSAWGVYPSTKHFLAQLEKNPIKGLNVHYIEIQGVGHTWGIPIAIEKGLQQLFSGFIAPEEIINGSLDDVKNYYRNLSQTWGFSVLPPTPVMTDFAKKEWQYGHKEEAIAVLDTFVQHQPDAAIAFYYRGRFQFNLGRYQEALISYKKALEAELRQTVPDGLDLLEFRKRTKEVEDVIASSDQELK